MSGFNSTKLFDQKSSMYIVTMTLPTMTKSDEKLRVDENLSE